MGKVKNKLQAVIITLKDGMVDNAVIVPKGEDEEKVFIDVCRNEIKKFDKRYDEDDIEDLLTDGIFEKSPYYPDETKNNIDSIQLTWAAVS